MGHEVLHPNERWLPSVVSFKSTVQPIDVTVRARLFGDIASSATRTTVGIDVDGTTSANWSGIRCGGLGRSRLLV